MFELAKKWMKASLVVMGGWASLYGQLDPRLQVTTSDFMDLYQGVTSGSLLKPEILLAMDFSTSTNRMMFHPLFPNNFNDEERFDSYSNYYSLYVTIASSGGTYGISKVGFGQGSLASTPSIVATNKTYYVGGTWHAGGKITNTLIKPDGTEVTLADVKATVPNANLYRSSVATPENYALNWVRCASHVRMSCTVGTLTRTVDFPINWAVLDATATGRPLSPTMVVNPISAGGNGLMYDIDATYLGTTNGGSYAQMRESGSQYTAELGASVGNVRLYRSRYVEWILLGTDAAGRYYVPDALLNLSCIVPPFVYEGGTNSFTYSTDNTSKTAFANGLPNRNRNQAIKEAFLRTWFNNQSGVNFAYRTLYNTGSTSSGGITTPYSMDTNRWGILNSSTPSTWTTITGQVPSSGQGTPLVPSQFDAYCQMANSGAFADQEAGLTKDQLDCLQHFVILLTDGSPTVNMPNEGTNSFPYLSSTQSVSIFSANSVIQSSLSSLNQSNAYWNNATLAGVAAHGGSRSSTSATDWIRDPAAVNYSGATTPSTWAPFWIQKRKFGGSGGTVYTLSKPHPIQTMTVGVSLGGYYTKSDGVTAWPYTSAIDLSAIPIPIQKDKTGSKFRLLMSAMCGDPATTTLTANAVKPFYRSGADKASDAVYFFDGRDPATLVSNLQDAFTDIQNMSAVNTTAAPVIPFVGMGLGQQIYITRFIPSQVSTNPVWRGDLSMFSTRQTGNSLQILDASGSTVTDLEAAVPNWSADNAIRNNRLWSARQVWTRLPGGTTLQRFTPFDDGTGGAPGSAFSNIKASVATVLASDAAKQQLIAWNLGADVSSAQYPQTPSDPNSAPSPACPNRQLPAGQTVPPGDILGDIVNSTPAVAEYTLNAWVTAQLPGTLSAQVAAAAGAGATPHFRVIFIGTNRGFLHAFGEVSYTQSTTDPNTNITTHLTKGDVDELWAFMPTEFLANQDVIGPTSTGKHRYGVDGTPYVWFLDLPASGAISGNGKVDFSGPSASGSENAMLVFGLRKGGRSYYGLNIQNPFVPSLGWSLVPDEAAAITSTNVDADAASSTTASALKAVVQNMGFSSCVPAVGRVQLGTTVKVRDVVFLGGGYSTPEVEAKFTGTPALGRSALALDVQTGKSVAVWDLSTLGAGPVAAGLVPFEFFLNSGFVQRVYFTDYKGSLWALGSGYTNATGTYANFRRDSNALDLWTVNGTRSGALNIRRVYQGSGKAWRDTTGANNAIYGMRPAPFLIGNYPGLATWTDGGGNTASINPAAVGIALVSGDRDNPLDKNYTSTTLPTRHRLTLVFDRQDSARTGLGLTSGVIRDGNLADFTNQTTAPASTYWNDNGSSTKFGYYLNFPSASASSDGNTYVSKGIYEPIVLDRVLFYSYFTPSSCTCSGGNGNTYTYRICDVMFPAWPGNGTTASTAPGCQSGVVANWIGVSSPMGVLSTAAAIQSGIQNFTPAGGGAATPGIGIQVFEGQLHAKFPKVRVWRTVR